LDSFVKVVAVAEGDLLDQAGVLISYLFVFDLFFFMPGRAERVFLSFFALAMTPGS